MNDETLFNPSSLSGRRILVTGASSGLGLAIVQSCARMSAEPIAIGRDQTRPDGYLTTLQSISELPHRVIQADLRVAEEHAAVVTVVGSEIHGLVHSAGISRLCPVRMMTEAHLHEVQSTNVDPPMPLTQALLKHDLVVPGGSTLFIAPITAHIGVAGVGAYSGIRAVLIAISRYLTIEVAKRNIRANYLSPSLVEMPLLDVAAQTIGSMDGQRSDHPMGSGEPEDIANAAISMLSDASRWATGMTLVMDGGLTIG